MTHKEKLIEAIEIAKRENRYSVGLDGSVKDWLLEKLKKEPSFDEMNEAYEKGLNDGRHEVWELIKEVSTTFTEEGLNKAFGYCSVEDVVVNYTPQEAIKTLKEYNESLYAEVGDVIFIGFEKVNAVVINNYYDSKEDEDVYTCVDSEGCVRVVNGGEFTRVKDKHIDVQSFLSQIGE